MRGGCVKKRQCVTVKRLATVPNCFVETIARNQKQGVNFHQEWFMNRNAYSDTALENQF